MQDNLENREAEAPRRRGRPRNSNIEHKREKIYEDESVVVEVCKACGKQVRMEIYRTGIPYRYGRCPKCGKHFCFSDDTSREV